MSQAERLSLRSLTSVIVGAMVTAAMLAWSPVTLAETESSVARGGRLYDKWYEVIGAEVPKTSHALYPKDRKYAAKPGANWRCKECHGWDYRGAAGAYGVGKHLSGIKGIDGKAGADPREIVAILKGPEHGYGDKLSDTDLHDVALFVSQGQVDMDQFIDRQSKSPKGNAETGAAYYNTVCANCHGKDGKQPAEMKPFAAQMGNPWEVMHKILNGHPGVPMPALRAFDWQATVDIMAHMATLPR